MATFEVGDEAEDGFGFDLSPLLDLPPEVEAHVDELVSAMRTPLAAGDPRRHHFVPQFFLRRFADGDQIARVPLQRPRKHQIAQVNDVAVMKDLYTTIDVDVGETVAVERLLALLDGSAVAPLERLATGVLFPPQRADRVSVATWLSMLHFRGPEFRRRMEAMTDQTIKMHLSLVHDEASARAFLTSEVGEPLDDQSVASLLVSVAELDSVEFAPHQNELVRMMLDKGLQATPFFLSRHWSIVRFPEKGLFLTDHPIVLYQKPENRSPWMGVGIGNADELWVPLDRRTALILHNEDLVGERVIEAPLEHSVDDFNQALVNCAIHEVYCHPEDLGRLRRIQLPNPQRPPMTMTGAGRVRAVTDGINAPPQRRAHRRYRRLE